MESTDDDRTATGGTTVDAVVIPAFDHTSLMVGDIVSTPYGSGKVVDYRGIKNIMFSDGSGCSVHEVTAKLCRRCGFAENRIHGFCSVMCETLYDLVDDIADFVEKSCKGKCISDSAAVAIAEDIRGTFLQSV